MFSDVIQSSLAGAYSESGLSCRNLEQVILMSQSTVYLRELAVQRGGWPSSGASSDSQESVIVIISMNLVKCKHYTDSGWSLASII